MTIFLRFLSSFLFDEAGGAGAGGSGAGGGSAGGAGAGGAGGAPAAGAMVDIRGHVGDDGSFKPGWSKALGVPDTLEQKFTRPDALARSYASLEKQIGAKGVILPGPNATAEERNAFFKALGRPDKPEEYGIKMPEKVGDAAFPKELWSDERAADFSKFAHEIGLTKDQAEKLVGYQAKGILGETQAAAQARQQSMATAQQALKTEWGANYDANLAAAERGAAASGLTAEVLKANPQLSNDPHFIKAMAKVGGMIAEQPGKGTREQAGSNGMSRADAAQKARELTATIAQKTKADRNWSNSPEATRLKAEKSRLFQIANPQ